MKGNTSQGNVFKGVTPAQLKVEAVQSASNFKGQTAQGFVNTKKSSQTAGFGASRKAGSIKGETC